MHQSNAPVSFYANAPAVPTPDLGATVPSGAASSVQTVAGDGYGPDAAPAPFTFAVVDPNAVPNAGNVTLNGATIVGGAAVLDLNTAAGNIGEVWAVVGSDGSGATWTAAVFELT